MKGPQNDISEWILHLCSDKKSLDCYVNSKGMTVEESQSLGESAKLGMQKVKVPVEKAVEAAGFVAAATTLITLHGSPPVWTLNFITASMAVTTVDIDAETGKITRRETTDILRKD